MPSAIPSASRGTPRSGDLPSPACDFPFQCGHLRGPASSRAGCRFPCCSPPIIHPFGKFEHGVTTLTRVPPAAAKKQREQAYTGHTPGTGLRYLFQFSKQAVRFPVGTRGEKEGVRTSERTAVAEPKPP